MKSEDMKKNRYKGVFFLSRNSNARVVSKKLEEVREGFFAAIQRVHNVKDSGNSKEIIAAIEAYGVVSAEYDDAIRSLKNGRALNYELTMKARAEDGFKSEVNLVELLKEATKKRRYDGPVR
jgi:hypothetical protein